MREIKFRAWDKKWERWIIPGGIYVYGDGSADFDRTAENGDTIETTELKHGEIALMQYTGLKDKNGVEIYEGDMLLYKKEPVIVEYVDDMFHCKSTKYPNLSKGNYRLATLCKECEVIGNIYENPTILK